MLSIRNNLLKVARSAPVVSTQVRNLILFDIMAKKEKTDKEVGNWPKTKEERIRAAKKYNLIPEDYEPYDFEDGFGDYPKFEAVGDRNKDRYWDYLDPFDRYNYGEVIHKDQDMYYWERIDPQALKKLNPPQWVRYVVLFFIAASMPTLYWLTGKYRITANHIYKIRDWDPNVPVYDFPSAR